MTPDNNLSLDGMSSDNPPAFPSRYEVDMGGGARRRDDRPGMSLRDYFAGQALAGMAGRLSDASNVAAGAYRFADAMLAAREEDQS
jgi:hypothetical protein